MKKKIIASILGVLAVTMLLPLANGVNATSRHQTIFQQSMPGNGGGGGHQFQQSMPGNGGGGGHQFQQSMPGNGGGGGHQFQQSMPGNGGGGGH